jgi:toxin-antitoxin system PIN domain toxin
MSVFLLDVNVLLALAWPAHEFHESARRWFMRKGSRSWATCPFTQAAFVRILSNPAFSARAVSLREAVNALKSSLAHPGHHFWADDISFPDAVATFANRLVGHRQVTDAYLLGLALHRKGSLATLDTRIEALLDETGTHRAHVELIS